jgi:hypothetical protein
MSSINFSLVAIHYIIVAEPIKADHIAAWQRIRVVNSHFGVGGISRPVESQLRAVAPNYQCIMKVPI